ncbi:hypothetical protein AMTR_s00078p00047370 [Amborella trichopoda]|uniref:Uncharacterized protein n=1 Tax=Amborella trichopoda TaxID=13333 RepID=W1P832_AMBTC|nr:hypothetical protein AMTR_s00078p00047370 [Amborella trichopoda]
MRQLTVRPKADMLWVPVGCISSTAYPRSDQKSPGLTRLDIIIIIIIWTGPIVALDLAWPFSYGDLILELAQPAIFQGRDPRSIANPTARSVAGYGKTLFGK